jgi:hypothetical protein
LGTYQLLCRANSTKHFDGKDASKEEMRGKDRKKTMQCALDPFALH